MHLEEFAEGRSTIHSIDPVDKILALLPLIVVTATAKGVGVPLFALAAGVGMAVLSRLKLRPLMERLYAVNIFVLFLWLVLPFTITGREVFSIGLLSATAEGLSYVFSITLKANAIMLFTIALVGTIPVFQLTHALNRLRIPKKLVSLFFFCYRYITVLHEDFSTLHNAMKVRAFKAGTNMHTYRSYAYLVGMLLVRSHHHSQKIYQAMLCRGFKGDFPLLQPPVKRARKDAYFLVSVYTVAGLMLIIEAGGPFFGLP